MPILCGLSVWGSPPAIITCMTIIGKILKGVFIFVLVVLIGCVLVVGVPNLIEYFGSSSKIMSASQVESSSTSYDCILVLGASVNSDGTPSTILQDRLDTAVALYDAGAASKIIVSGDAESDSSYDEVTGMKAYLVKQGIPSSDIFCDHAGINTYDSMYRAKNVFSVKTMIVVTQTYHQYRALYDANALGISAVGVASDIRTYADQRYYDVREIFARVSDFRKVFTKASSTYLSEPVSLSQSGDVTSW